MPALDDVRVLREEVEAVARAEERVAVAQHRQLDAVSAIAQKLGEIADLIPTVQPGLPSGGIPTGGGTLRINDGGSEGGGVGVARGSGGGGGGAGGRLDLSDPVAAYARRLDCRRATIPGAILGEGWPPDVQGFDCPEGFWPIPGQWSPPGSPRGSSGGATLSGGGADREFGPGIRHRLSQQQAVHTYGLTGPSAGPVTAPSSLSANKLTADGQAITGQLERLNRNLEHTPAEQRAATGDGY